MSLEWRMVTLFQPFTKLSLSLLRNNNSSLPASRLGISLFIHSGNILHRVYSLSSLLFTSFFFSLIQYSSFLSFLPRSFPISQSLHWQIFTKNNRGLMFAASKSGTVRWETKMTQEKRVDINIFNRAELSLNPPAEYSVDNSLYSIMYGTLYTSLLGDRPFRNENPVSAFFSLSHSPSVPSWPVPTGH